MDYLVFVDVGHWFGGYGAHEPGFEDTFHYTKIEDVTNKLVEVWAKHGLRGVEIDFVVCENYEQVINHFKRNYLSTEDAEHVKEILTCENDVLRRIILDKFEFRLREYTNKKLEEAKIENEVKREKRIKELEQELKNLTS